MSNLTKSAGYKALIPKLKSLGFSEVEINKELTHAADIVSRSKELKACDATSILRAVYNALNCGLTLNPIQGEVALVARWNSHIQCKEATFQPMYKGLIRLMKAEGDVKTINVQLVYKGDDIEIDMSDTQNPVKRHVADFGSDVSDENIIGGYCIIESKNGAKNIEVMRRIQIDEIREYSDGWKAFKAGNIKSTPWSSSYGEMARKTILRRGYKYVGRSDSEKLSKAIEADNQDYFATQWQKDTIERLLPTSTIGHEKREEILGELEMYPYHTANDLIQNLKDNQLDAIRDMGGEGQITKGIAESLDNTLARETA